MFVGQQSRTTPWITSSATNIVFDPVAEFSIEVSGEEEVTISKQSKKASAQYVPSYILLMLNLETTRCPQATVSVWQRESKEGTGYILGSCCLDGYLALTRCKKHSKLKTIVVNLFFSVPQPSSMSCNTALGQLCAPYTCSCIAGWVP